MWWYGVVGLGRLCGNLTLRLVRTGHRGVVDARNAEIVGGFAEAGTETAAGLEELVARLDAPRAVWLMLSAGRVTAATVRLLADLLSPHDFIIDGGNSFYNDALRPVEPPGQFGTASCRASGCQYVSFSVVDGDLQTITISLWMIIHTTTK